MYEELRKTEKRIAEWFSKILKIYATIILATNGLSAFWYALKEYDVNVAALYGVFGFLLASFRFSSQYS